MLKRTLLLLVTGTVLLAAGCSSDEEAAQEGPTPPAKTVDRHNSAVVTYGQHVGAFSTIISDTISYYDGVGNLVLQKIRMDTVPSLGMTKDTLDTGRTETDENGDEQPVDTIIDHRRSYQFFITVK